MSEADFMTGMVILTTLSYLVLLLIRMHILNQVKREINKIRTEWKDERYERAEWQKKFEEEHQSPWVKKRTA
jgi:queuine/archaeosine tRNA-ribosyltransferase